jgi:hypothetical protein
MSYDYKARFVRTGEDTEIKSIFLSTNAEAYVDGEIVTLGSGTVTQSAATGTTVLGICRKAGTGVTGTPWVVEVPLHRYAEVEMYSDGALTAGTAYGLNDNGSVKSSETSSYLRVIALVTIGAAGWTRVKFRDAALI